MTTWGDDDGDDGDDGDDDDDDDDDDVGDDDDEGDDYDDDDENDENDDNDDDDYVERLPCTAASLREREKLILMIKKDKDIESEDKNYYLEILLSIFWW